MTQHKQVDSHESCGGRVIACLRRVLYLRVVIGGVSAFFVLAVAAVALLVTASASLKALNDNGEAHVAVLGNAAAYRVTSFFSKPYYQTSALSAFTRVHGASLPSEHGSAKLNDSYRRLADVPTGGIALDLLVAATVQSMLDFNLALFGTGFWLRDGTRMLVFPLTSAAFKDTAYLDVWWRNNATDALDQRETTLYDTKKEQVINASDPRYQAFVPIQANSSALIDVRIPFYWNLIEEMVPTKRGTPVTWTNPRFFHRSGSTFRYILALLPAHNATDLLGVAVSGISLETIGAELDATKKSPESMILVVTQDGFVLGASDNIETHNVTAYNGQPAVLPAGCSSTDETGITIPSDRRLISCMHHLRDIPVPAAQMIAQQYDFSGMTSMQMRQFKVIARGQKCFARIQPISGINLNASVIVLIPEKEILGDVKSSIMMAGAITIGAVVAAAIMCVGLLWWLLHPLQRVAARMSKAARLVDDPEPIVISPLVEIGDLQRAFIAMREKLTDIRSYVPHSLLQAVDSDDSTESLDGHDDHSLKHRAAVVGGDDVGDDQSMSSFCSTDLTPSSIESISSVRTPQPHRFSQQSGAAMSTSTSPSKHNSNHNNSSGNPTIGNGGHTTQAIRFGGLATRSSESAAPGFSPMTIGSTALRSSSSAAAGVSPTTASVTAPGASSWAVRVGTAPGSNPPVRASRSDLAAVFPSAPGAVVAGVVGGAGGAGHNGRMNPLMNPATMSNSTKSSSTVAPRSHGVKIVDGLRRESVSILSINVCGFHDGFGKKNAVNQQKIMSDLVDAVLTAAAHEKGVIDSFQGDRFLISFNAVKPAANHEIRAVTAATHISEAVRLLGFRTTAGVASGRAQIGNMGSKRMMRFTIVGPVVVQATALERLCKIYQQNDPCHQNTEMPQQEPGNRHGRRNSRRLSSQRTSVSKGPGSFSASPEKTKPTTSTATAPALMSPQTIAAKPTPVFNGGQHVGVGSGRGQAAANADHSLSPRNELCTAAPSAGSDAPLLPTSAQGIVTIEPVLDPVGVPLSNVPCQSTSPAHQSARPIQSHNQSVSTHSDHSNVTEIQGLGNASTMTVQSFERASDIAPATKRPFEVYCLVPQRLFLDLSTAAVTRTIDFVHLPQTRSPCLVGSIEHLVRPGADDEWMYQLEAQQEGDLSSTMNIMNATWAACARKDFPRAQELWQALQDEALRKPDDPELKRAAACYRLRVNCQGPVPRDLGEFYNKSMRLASTGEV